MAHIPKLRLKSIKLSLCPEWFEAIDSWQELDELDDWLAHPGDTDVASSSDEEEPTRPGGGQREVVGELDLLQYLRGQAVVGCDGETLSNVLAPERLLITTLSDSNDDMDLDSESDTTSECSVDYRRRTAPRWVWTSFHDGSDSAKAQFLAFQVPATYLFGHRTELWRFTSRHGEVGYGDDPWAWFDDWDLEAGDKEEPLPYCDAFRDFALGRRPIIHLFLPYPLFNLEHGFEYDDREYWWSRDHGDDY